MEFHRFLLFVPNPVPLCVSEGAGGGDEATHRVVWREQWAMTVGMAPPRPHDNCFEM